MYKLISFADVSQNFTVQFKMCISPFFDRAESNKTGKLVFLTDKFVKYLMKERGYGGSAHEPLQNYVCRKFGDNAWTLLKRLM